MSLFMILNLFFKVGNLHKPKFQNDIVRYFLLFNGYNLLVTTL